MIISSSTPPLRQYRQHRRRRIRTLCEKVPCLALLGNSSSTLSSMLARSLGRVSASSARHVRVLPRTCVSSFVGGCSWSPSSIAPSSTTATPSVFPQLQHQHQQLEKSSSSRRYLSSKKRPPPGAGEEEEENDVDGKCRCCAQAFFFATISAVQQVS